MLRIPVFAASAASAADLPPLLPAEAALLRHRLEETDANLRHLLAERDRVRGRLAVLERPSLGASPVQRALSAVEDPGHELDDPAFLSATKIAAGEVPRRS